MNSEGESMQRRRLGPVRHEKAHTGHQHSASMSLPQVMHCLPSLSKTGASRAYPVRLLFEHLCVVANALERVVQHEVTTNTLDWALDALDHIIDRVAESLPKEDE